MRKLHSLLVLGLCLWACGSERAAQALAVPSEVLFENFALLGEYPSRSLRNAWSYTCRSEAGGNDQQLAFENCLVEYREAIKDAQGQIDALGAVRVAMLDFVHAHDSLLRLGWGEDADALLLSPTVPARYTGVVSPATTDTVLLMTEATRVLLQACRHFDGVELYCDPGYDIPYVEVSGGAHRDTIAVRVGLRVERFCESSESYAVVLGDTVRHNSFGWADFRFSRKQIGALDTLRVESCVGNALTGERHCTWRSVASAW